MNFKKDMLNILRQSKKKKYLTLQFYYNIIYSSEGYYEI